MENKKYKLLNFRPFLFIALSLIMGIVVEYLIIENKTTLAIVLSSVFFLLYVIYCYFLKNERSIRSIIIFFVISVLFFGVGITCFYKEINDYKNADLDNHYYTISGRIEEIKTSDNQTTVIMKNVRLTGNKDIQSKYKIALYISQEAQDFEIGDKLTTFALLNDRGINYEGHFSSNDISRGVKYFAWANLDEIVKSDSSLTVFEKVNLKIKQTLKQGLKEDTFSVSYALLTGSSEYMDSETLTDFRYAGVAHIFAVSGLHIGFLASVLWFVFSKLKINRYIKIILISFILFFYSGVCGFSSSSIRASIMCVVLYLSTLLGERYDGLTSLSISAIIILIFEPVQLFCVGFQLSFGVVLSIIILSNPIAGFFKFLPNKISQSLGVVISAQLAGIPISLYAFNQFSVIAILANLVFIPIVGFIFISLFVSVLICVIIPNVSWVFYVSHNILKIVIYLISIVDYDAFIVGGFSLGAFALFYYLAMLVYSELLNLKQVVKAIVSIVCVVVCVFGTVGLNKREFEKTKIYVMGQNSVSCVLVSNRDENSLIIVKTKGIFSLGKLYALKNRTGIEKVDNLILMNYSETLDVQSVLTRLNCVYDFDNIFYYGDDNETVNRIIKKSFPIKNVNGVTTGFEMCNNYKLSYKLNGSCLLLKSEDKNITIFTQYGNSKTNYRGLEENVDFVIAYDYLYDIKKTYNPKLMISFRNNSNYVNGEKEGTFKLYLN